MAIVDVMPSKKAPIAPRAIKMFLGDVDGLIVEGFKWSDETEHVLSPFSESLPRS